MIFNTYIYVADSGIRALVYAGSRGRLNTLKSLGSAQIVNLAVAKNDVNKTLTCFPQNYSFWPGGGKETSFVKDFGGAT